MMHPKSVVLINSNGIKPKNTLKKRIFKILSTIYQPLNYLQGLETIRQFIYKFIIREKDYLNTKEMVRESFKLFNEEHYDDKLDNIDVDTLIIWGSEDKVTPLWMGELLKLKIKNSKLKVVKDTHGLPLKQPKVVYKLIKDFLNG
jgi:pimeloyl-ACP methyl ester carboxylesterase